MPNLCDANIRIRGRKEAIDEFIKMLKVDYNYSLGVIPDRHFFRIFETHVNQYYNAVGVVWFAEISIVCAWSVYSCMMDGPYTYYNDASIESEYWQKYGGCHGTNLVEESRRLKLDIEIFSEELGMVFQEHYRIMYGNTIVDEERSIDYLWIGDFDTLAEYIQYMGENDLGIETEEEFQILRSRAREDGVVFYDPEAAAQNFTISDRPNYMVNVVMVKRRRKE